MAKVHINGEIFDYDLDSKPLAEMIALEKALNVTYGKWQEDLTAGSATAIAGFVWLVWRRDGRDVPLDDILSGKAAVEYGQFRIEGDEPPDPTTAGGTQEASTTTAGGTSRRSARSA